MKTKGEIEAEISEAWVRSEIDVIGQSPKAARSYIIEDMILARLRVIPAPAE